MRKRKNGMTTKKTTLFVSSWYILRFSVPQLHTFPTSSTHAPGRLMSKASQHYQYQQMLALRSRESRNTTRCDLYGGLESVEAPCIFWKHTYGFLAQGGLSGNVWTLNERPSTNSKKMVKKVFLDQRLVQMALVEVSAPQNQPLLKSKEFYCLFFLFFQTMSFL